MNSVPREIAARTPIARSADSTDWLDILRRCLLSRALDSVEEQLVPKREVLYQFSARGHELSQVLVASQLTHPDDGVAVYYRSRPLMLGLGFEPEDALAATMMRAGSMTEGRDIGVVFNWPGRDGRPTVLPSCGGVGAQYTPAVGWAQALKDRRERLEDKRAVGAVAVVHGGDASTSTNGFWSAVNIAAVRRLPILFFIEDNGYGISVPSSKQTPGGNVAATLSGLRNLSIVQADVVRPVELAARIDAAFEQVRADRGPVLLRVQVPRLNGHSYQDNQAYKRADVLELERARDPFLSLRRELVPKVIDEKTWKQAETDASQRANAAYESVKARPLADASSVHRYRFTESKEDGTPELQLQGGLAPLGLLPAMQATEAAPSGPRINMIAGIRRTLESELERNPRMVVFGEDVGAKGGVHGVTAGLQERFGDGRVFDTGLSEEGIVGRAVGMALAGLLPVPEIQFRKYAEPATEQLVDCGTMRWRTSNRFAAPMVVRMPCGFAKCGDPWHSMTNEAFFLHAVGWRVAFPSNAEDAVGLLRAALRGNDPTVFFEHRAMLDTAWARRAYPGDDFVVPFGVARTLKQGNRATIVTWGAMVERCEQAIDAAGGDVTLIDLRSLMPWDREAVLESVRQTRRLMIVHEDQRTAGFGAEIAAVAGRELFFELDAPIERLAMDDIPSPHCPVLLEAAVPTVASIGERLRALCEA